jgi:hypothetical protein
MSGDREIAVPWKGGSKARLRLRAEIERPAQEVSDNGTANSDIGDREILVDRHAASKL